MDNQTYLSASEVTEKKFPEGLQIPAKEFHDLADLFMEFKNIASKIDTLKRAIIYHGVPVDGQPFVNLTQQQAEFLHSIMGLVTEVAEIADELGPELAVKDVNHFKEELGDCRWYEAIFLRHLNLTAEEVQAANIRKLARRYPDKFTSFAALNRNLDAERASLEN